MPNTHSPNPAMPASMNAATWHGTRALIASDLARLVDHMEAPDTWGQRLYLALLPGFQALFWHRITRCLLLKGWRMPARLLALMATYLTRAELPPSSSIGHSALIAHATGVYVYGQVGDRLTIQGDGGFGGGFGVEDIGAGPGYAIAGDDVVLAFGARVLGPVRIGHRVHVGPGALVTFDVPDGALVLWDKPRVIKGGALGR